MKEIDLKEIDLAQVPLLKNETVLLAIRGEISKELPTNIKKVLRSIQKGLHIEELSEDFVFQEEIPNIIVHEEIVEISQNEDSNVKDKTPPRRKIPGFELSSAKTSKRGVGVTPHLIPHQKKNSLGMYITEEDNCFHLAKWKGGSCIKQGFKPCPFLGGGQTQCSLYTELEEGRREEKSKRRL